MIIKTVKCSECSGLVELKKYCVPAEIALVCTRCGLTQTVIEYQTDDLTILAPAQQEVERTYKL